MMGTHGIPSMYYHAKGSDIGPLVCTATNKIKPLLERPFMIQLKEEMYCINTLIILRNVCFFTMFFIISRNIPL